MKINKILIGVSLLGSCLIAGVASAQYYDPNQYYNNNNSYQNNYQQQPYTLFNHNKYLIRQNTIYTIAMLIEMMKESQLLDNGIFKVIVIAISAKKSPNTTIMLGLFIIDCRYYFNFLK